MAIVEKVLFSTDFRELSFVVAQQLRVLAKAGMKEIVFVYVIDRDDVSFDLARGFDEDLAEKIRAEAESRFVDWEKRLDQDGVKARHRIELGNPPVEIRRAAEDESADLIVIGREAEKGFDRIYLDGVAMDVLRDSRFAVYVAKPRVDDPSSDDRDHNPFQRVLFATDFSDASERAQAYLKGLGSVVEEVDVLHVMSDRDPDPTDEQESLDAIAADLAGVGEVRTHVRRGRPTQEILRVREAEDSTLVVMGTTGKHGISEVFLGSCSHRVAEVSGVPVILVPGPRR